MTWTRSKVDNTMYYTRIQQIIAKESFSSLKRGKAESLLHKLLEQRTKGIFSDTSWQPYHKILDDFQENEIDYTVDKNEYYRSPSAISDLKTL